MRAYSGARRGMSATRSSDLGSHPAQPGVAPLEPTELRRRRRALGLTQADLANRLAVSANTVARWERGELRVGRPRQVARTLARLERTIQIMADPAGGLLESWSAAAASRRSPSTPQAAPTQRRAPARIKHNLPVERTSLVGREQELAAIRVALLQSNGRLITLTGPGGAGKTRLAQRLGRDLVEHFADGVWLVDAAPMTDPARLPQTAAAVLGVRERPDQPMLDTLVQALSGRQVLLVLDNCEHLIGACATLAGALLSGCPRLRLLATSREPLHLAGEAVWLVPPLAVPTLQPQPELEELLSYAAVCLFVDRARSVRSDFALTARNASAVAQICSLLEGLPLALELAAARVRVLGTEQIEEQLRDSLQLLVDDTRSTPGRYRSVAAALDWSDALLSEPERTVFHRLTVFAGGWTLEAAEAVCGDGELRGARVLDVLTRLVDKSLVLMEEEEGHARYRLLEPIRQYAYRKLLARGEAPTTRQRHARYFCQLSEDLDSTSIGQDAQAVNDRMQRELANFRAAMAWAIESGEPEAGLRLAAALGRFWTTRGWLSEGREWFKRLLNLPAGSCLTPVRAKALQVAGNTAYYQGDHAAAATLVAASVAVRRQLSDPAGLAEALDAQGLVDWARAELGSAQTALTESLQLARGLGLRKAEGRILYHLGLVAYDSGDAQAAQDWHRQSMAVATELRDVLFQARAYYGLGQVARQRGDVVEARALHEAGLACRREAGEHWGMALALVGLGQVALDEGDIASARALFFQSLAFSRELGDTHGLARCLEGMAAVAAQVQPEHALQLAGAAAALRESSCAPLPPTERALLERRLAPARTTLGEDRSAAFLAAGRTCPVDKAIELAFNIEAHTPAAASRPPAGVSGSSGPLTRRQRATAAIVSGSLTARQTEVLGLIAQGKTDRQIAVELVLSEKTVGRHLENIFTRLGVSSRAAATVVAVRDGLA